MLKPDYLFETSWEVCNKVGGIHSVISTKALSVKTEIGSHYILIGPDILKHETDKIEFIEDPKLYLEWKNEAHNQGLRVRVGKWNIEGNPTVILVDFSTFFGDKDTIFSNYWEKYQLDSLTGQWDYIEPALFGYAAGKVIESFVDYFAHRNDKVVAHFHEWMTGSGILYLKQFAPEISTVFTTHATVAGRGIASNNLPLYKGLQLYNSDMIALDLNVIAKHSMEKIVANTADIFTTVSDITAQECKYLLGKDVNFITPDGFEPSFVPTDDDFQAKRAIGRKKLLEVASALLGYKISNDALLITTSGRYEFRNKGIDIFIDALAKINTNKDAKKDIITFMLVPTNQYGYRKDLFAKINGEGEIQGSRYLTHVLHDQEWDPSLNKFKALGLNNNENDNVKVIMVPSYLNGNDGIFNLDYYDLLIGMDLTVFPSYYEPWGYAALESLAFSIPTISSTLAGFGLWINKEYNKKSLAASIIERNDDNQTEAIDKLYSVINQIANCTKDEINLVRLEAHKISEIALWKNLISNYSVAYDKAIVKSSERDVVEVKYKSYREDKKEQFFIIPKTNDPYWRTITVKSSLPDSIKALYELSNNLWWTWDDEAQQLFQSISPQEWIETGLNPLALIERVPSEKWNQLVGNKEFMALFNSVMTRFTAYMKEPLTGPQIAYLSMEFGFHDVLKIFSGGLGLLAGDYLKEASDKKMNLIGFGLLYRYGYFKQGLTPSGDQVSQYDYQDFNHLPITQLLNEDGSPKQITINLPGRSLYARVWVANIGRIKLHLLDTDFDHNNEEDRSITHNLYGGDNENRLKQEILLGIGGIRMIEQLSYKPQIYHSNEGHSAFINLERIRKFIQDDKMTFTESLELVRSSTLFTTHTPVPAGHDEFEENLMRKYMSHYPARLYLNWTEFMSLGRVNPNNSSEKFNMSHLACHLAQEINGVSKIHGDVSQDMFVKLWPGFFPKEIHVGYVTNGVHYPTWAAKEWKDMLKTADPVTFENGYPHKEFFSIIDKVDDEKIWKTKKVLRTKLVNFIKERYEEDWIQKSEDPKHIVAVKDSIRPDVLTIGFARRFATYKRAHLLFRNIKRLEKIVNNPKQPIQFFFAGKAHPHDKMGQDLIKMIIEISKRPEFVGKIIFLQNYDINLAKFLVQGVDIWLNTPTRPLEASGTSGEKAIMNGTLHFSVLDGWWGEGYVEDAGWALSEEQTYSNHEYQDDLDAETIYSMLENQIAPAYYNQNDKGVSSKWVGFMRKSYREIAPEFTTDRMWDDYINRFYNKLFERNKRITANNYEFVEEITGWKSHIAKNWDMIEVVSVKGADSKKTYFVNNEFSGEVTLNLNEIGPNEVKVEFVIVKDHNTLVDVIPLNLIRNNGKTATYANSKKISLPGTFSYGIRIMPYIDLLPYKQDTGFVKWV